MTQDIPQVTLEIAGEMITFDLDDINLPDAIKDNAFKSGGYPYDKKLSRKNYEKELYGLQLELGKLQAWLQETGERVVIVFEGRDAAGKGGTINAFRQYLNPRHAKVVALSKPSDTERGQWYFQRYVSHLPTSGEMIMFDRSWYNRAGVEPVMGFCSDEQHKHFLKETPQFEDMLVSEGIHFFKFWLNVGQEMQLKRFHDRRQNYTNARNLMLEATHTKHAPWTIVRSNDKKRARLNAIKHFLQHVDYAEKDPTVIGQTDPDILGSGPDFFNDFGA